MTIYFPVAKSQEEQLKDRNPYSDSHFRGFRSLVLAPSLWVCSNHMLEHRYLPQSTQETGGAKRTNPPSKGTHIPSNITSSHYTTPLNSSNYLLIMVQVRDDTWGLPTQTLVLCVREKGNHCLRATVPTVEN